ncbi:hypothetical protein L292_0551 [Acinetobacter junii CIP 107470 = MTCC 11364]|uniref:Uncharacterized protein n=1 Tax=Acinetobacter junii CIP 107470 = MTCC 11364 TaxID=1217666 RepID=S7Y4Y8_ACIJU|nr:hypothetical protein [Acinetobacter junii]ENV52048.1 hypothetical protein F953_00538 [Acinetobacter junii CIP 107470 = MTCC 11364]EPR83073.1 hypothetical protein L292_0551 [Acinetobacter junii CIP 107470 = MTCC 11364]
MNKKSDQVIVITFLNQPEPIRNDAKRHQYGWAIKNSLNHSINETLSYDAKDFYEFEVIPELFYSFIEWITSHVDTKAFYSLSINWESDFALSSTHVNQLTTAFNDHLRVASQSIYTSEHSELFKIYLEFSAALNFSNTGIVIFKLGDPLQHD